MYPQSNGNAEATVKSMKKLIQAGWDRRHLHEVQLTCSLLQYKNTPSRKDNLSPSQTLFGKPIEDKIPAHQRAFADEWQCSRAEFRESRMTVDCVKTSHVQ